MITTFILAWLPKIVGGKTLRSIGTHAALGLLALLVVALVGLSVWALWSEVRDNIRTAAISEVRLTAEKKAREAVQEDMTRLARRVRELQELQQGSEASLREIEQRREADQAELSRLRSLAGAPPFSTALPVPSGSAGPCAIPLNRVKVLNGD